MIDSSQNDDSLMTEVVGSLDVGVCVWELMTPGDPSSLVLRTCTGAAARFLSVEQDAVIGRAINDGFPGALSTPMPGLFMKVIESGESMALGDVPYRDQVVPDGMFSIVVHPVGSRCAAVEFTNVTEARQAQADAKAQLGAAEAARRDLAQSEKMASLGLLVAGIAHEIKNPLNFLNNFSDLAIEFISELKEKRFAAEPLDLAEVASTLDEVAKNLARIREHGQRADDIVSAMLMHARERYGESVSVDLNAFISEKVKSAVEAFQSVYEGSALEVEEVLDPKVGVVLLPAQEVARVVASVVDNACYAIHERQAKGGMGDERPQIFVQTTRQPRSVDLHIRDNGAGMSGEVRRRAFDPFYTTKPPREGTGLGLSLAYDLIVKGLGGAIEARSEAGKGAEFVLRFPVLGRGVEP